MECNHRGTEGAEGAEAAFADGPVTAGGAGRSESPADAGRGTLPEGPRQAGQRLRALCASVVAFPFRKVSGAQSARGEGERPPPAPDSKTSPPGPYPPKRPPV